MINFNFNEESCESQNKQIAEWLNEGNSLTQMEALERFGCFRLASRIHDLRSRGLDIEKEMILSSSGKRVARYYIINGEV